MKEHFKCLYCETLIEVKSFKLPAFIPGRMIDFSTLLDYECPTCHHRFAYDATSKRYEVEGYYLPPCPFCGEKEYVSRVPFEDNDNFYMDQSGKYPRCVFAFTCHKCANKYYYDVIKGEYVK